MAIKRMQRGKGVLGQDSVTISLDDKSSEKERREAAQELENFIGRDQSLDATLRLYRAFAEKVLAENGKKFGSKTKPGASEDEAVWVITRTIALRDAIKSNDVETVARAAMDLEHHMMRLRIRREKKSGPLTRDRLERENELEFARECQRKKPHLNNHDAAKWIHHEAQRRGMVVSRNIETTKKHIKMFFLPKRGRPKIPRN